MYRVRAEELRIGAEAHHSKECHFKVKACGIAGRTKIRAILPCGCSYSLTVPGEPSVKYKPDGPGFLVFSPAGKKVGCHRCQADKFTTPTAVSQQEGEASNAAFGRPASKAEPCASQEEPRDQPPDTEPCAQPPSWWLTPDFDIRFAEVLFLHKMCPPNIDHCAPPSLKPRSFATAPLNAALESRVCADVFRTIECEERFPRVSTAEWLDGTTLSYLEESASGRGPIRAHWQELRSKRACVVEPPPVDAGADQHRRKRRCNVRGAAASRVWVDSTGTRLYTNEDGRVLRK